MLVGFGDVKVLNGTLEDGFHAQCMPINLLSNYHACQKGYKFEVDRLCWSWSWFN